MNGLPESEPVDDPLPTEASGADATEPVPNPEFAQARKPDEYPVSTPLPVDESPFPDSGYTLQPAAPEPPMFQSYYQLPQTRIPHLGHLAVLGVFIIFGMIGALILFWIGLRFHWFGISSLQTAATDIHYTLGSEAVLYFVMVGACVLFFPMIWNKSFFAGIQWNGAIALRLRQQLFLTAAICFALALVNGLLLPGPKDAPIDKIFRTPGAAWLLFGFGVTIAPFAEELIFRGFLLPALCTACDWINEKTKGVPVRPLDENGQPQWSFGAMVVGSIATSLPFAAMHAAQTGYSWGPFILLVGVSLALCWARLSTRSLAASVLVHASYNFLLFSLMMLGTGGFKHLDKM
jgi:membrane protease YdiL (CAAX protease family)